MDEFLNAIQQNDSAKAKKLLVDALKGGVLQKKDLLPFCARHNQTEILEQLIALGAPMNQIDGLGMSALHYCAERNALQTISVLVYSGANVDLRDSLGRTALMLAIKRGHKEIFQALIREIKNVDAVDQRGNSALKMAVESGQIDLARILVEEKASLNLADSQGMTPLFFAAGLGNEEMVSFLVRSGADVNALDKQRRSATMIAAAMGQIKVIQQLIKAGADINAVDIEGNNVLHFISSGYQPELVQHIKGNHEVYLDNTKIVVKGKALDPNRDAETFLVKSIRSIVNPGFSEQINREIQDGRQAARNRLIYLELAQLLAQNGIAVNQQNINLETPLHRASQLGFQEDVEFLLKAGADPQIKNAQGKTAIDLSSTYAEIQTLYAAFKGGPSSVPVSETPPTPPATATPVPPPSAPVPIPDLDVKPAPISSPEAPSTKPAPAKPVRKSDAAFLVSCANGDMGAVYRLVKSGVDIHQKDTQGRTGLMLAAAQGKRVTVSYLLKSGLSPEEKDSQGSNALAHAISNEQVETVKTLCEAGADVNGRSGGTPLVLLAISKGNLELTQYLLDRGARILEKDEKGAGAVEYALVSKSKDMSRLVTSVMNTQTK